MKKWEEEYQEGTGVQQARKAYESAQAQRPGAYSSQWADKQNAAWDAIQNRKPFQYDINKDALYNQYKDQYIRGGRLAMMDTMGQAAALTGGYGSSYAQQVGQQAYQGYLQGLNDKVPELYQQALNQYNQEGDALLQQYSLLGERENQDYSRYRDAMSQWMNERDAAASRYDTERNLDYSQYNDNRSFGYQQDRDAAADEQWQQQFDYGKTRDAVSDDQWNKQYQTALDHYLYEHPDYERTLAAIRDGSYFNQQAAAAGDSGGGGGPAPQNSSDNTGGENLAVLTNQATRYLTAGLSESAAKKVIAENVSGTEKERKAKAQQVYDTAVARANKINKLNDDYMRGL